jgi:O-antigen/teichoic acid export membrane protein
MGPLRSAYIKLSSYSTRLAIVGVTACVLANHDLVRLWVGNAQYGGALLTGVFCIRIFQEANIRGTGGVLLATGRIRAWALASIVETLLTAILLVVLVRAYGLVGAALGSLLGRTLTIAWIVPWLVCRAIGLPISRYVMEGIVQPALWSLPGALAVVAIVSLISVPVSWPYLAALMILCFGANALCFEGRQWIRSFSNAES